MSGFGQVETRPSISALKAGPFLSYASFSGSDLTECQHNTIVVSMIPPFNEAGLLPPGIHTAEWRTFVERFDTSPRRAWLIKGLLAGLIALRSAGCQVVYIDGSFVTDKSEPEDFDALWDAAGVNGSRLNSVFLDFSARRMKQKLKYRGEFFPVHALVEEAGVTFLEFFQRDKDSGDLKGIVRIELDTLP
jgi:hypothetical protein